MTHPSKESPRLSRLSYAVSIAIVSMINANAAFAQATATAAQDKQAEGITSVTVIGARASQQSAITKKKNADTAQDSIIAEDVGAFPDRNVADAISRVAGVAVDRGEFGEGISVSIRGNGPELTRVELDGQGVQQAGGTDMLGGITAGEDGAGGRGVEMRQLSSDLIKSVDVVKGSTADMTEGSLGGSVRIETRNGLDFKKDYLSIRAAAQMNTINEKKNPNLNLVGVKKLMDGRLGVLVNLSKSKLEQESHSITQGGTSNRVGTYLPLDFDNSPEKTFSFQPGTVKDDPVSRTPNFTYPLTAGGSWTSHTPQEIVEMSAAAQTKADCYAAFPLLTTAQANQIASASRNNAINARYQELSTCLGQWNDWVPSGTRYALKRWNTDRESGDIRLDFKVNNNLTVYVKHSRSTDNVMSTSSNMGYGGVGTNETSVNGPNGYTGTSLIDTQATTPRADGAWGTRAVAPGSNYYLYPGLSSHTGGPVYGITSNVNPATVVVDANHMVTSYEFSDGLYGVDSTWLDIRTKSRYTQAGGTYRNGIFKATFLLGDASSDFSRAERRVGYSAYVGPVTATLLPNGTWGYAQQSTIDVNDPNNFFRLTPSAAVAANAGNATTRPTLAYGVGQQPLVNATRQLPFQNARINESTERTAKLDATLNISDYAPFLTQLKAGFNRRKSSYDAWSTGGYTVSDAVGTFGTAGYIPAVVVPSNNLRTTFQICQDTPGSLAPGGKPCQYGYTAAYNPASALQGNIVISPEQYRELFKQTFNLTAQNQFYKGDPDRPANLINGWTEIDIGKLYDMLGVPNYNLNCIKTCVASDGKVYDQPHNAVAETVDAGYLMTDFSVDRFPFTEKALPFGLEIEGNFGYRVVKTKVVGTGQLTFVSIAKVPGVYNPLDPDNEAGITRRTFRQNTSINANTTDYLPALNLNTWLVPDRLVLRYNKSKTIARPPAGRLIPSGTCTYDQRSEGMLDDDGEPLDQGCTGTMGNPELKPQTNRNQNLSLEWYVNKDTMLSGAIYKQKGIIGAATLTEKVNGATLFGGSGVVDPQTGQALSDLQFNYNRWTNQLPNTRKGFELSSKTAFTFLPWYLRYTGLDANYTRNKSEIIGTAVRDLLTGTVMPVANEPHHSWNASLWYDDGKLSARVALQVVSEKFRCISGCNSEHSNYPANGDTSVETPAYSPGAPIFNIGTRYVDAKLGYKINDQVELFVEGRNLGKAHTGSTTGPIQNYANGTVNMYTDNYSGATYMAGVNFKFQ